MSVIVSHLTKRYSDQLAVDDLSFEAKPGEILGFLGPNGAGKSTTLKIIAGVIHASAGQVSVCKHDVVVSSILARRQIGYLPEHNPLYLEMFVHEYLRFIGRINGLGGVGLRSRIREIVEVCGLGPEQNKILGSLSKGYRQRVGLAQALLSDPPVLILDEPTSGLDPNQIIEIRNLIKDISKDKTLIFSSHILSEVQTLSDRVLIISRGKQVLNELTSQVQPGLARTKNLIVEFNQPVQLAELGAITGVLEVKALEPRKYQLKVETGEDIRPLVFKFASEKQKTLVELREQKGSLEEVFQELTR